ncbi:MAG: hypothetical protein ACTH9T_04840 [Mycetocola reblochoni]|uniref:Uncharacterized protein n=2 Tax=Mycetocola reblochoni TaxID=331618 RepID=A0A1R4IWM9_9MICO|nr:hypothetical protein [Mycetocola reblochoni]RLP70971.1 hypothetical protein D9V30_00625 [Mycetocola reblochoni]SJN24089.1 hypothetical protein FM119_04000 [Mycetocola reblochoni REB411]
MTSARHQLAAALTPLLPPTWRIVPYERSIDRPSSVVVMLKQSTITRHPSAPDGAHLVEFVVTIISPHEDNAAAEDQLDDGVIELTHALDDAGLGWDTATKVSFADRFMAYDIAVNITTTKEN